MHTLFKHYRAPLLGKAMALITATGKAIERSWGSKTADRAKVLSMLSLFLVLAAGHATASAGGAVPDAAIPPSSELVTECSGVPIFPGTSADSIQSMIDAHPAGTVFC